MTYEDPRIAHSLTLRREAERILGVKLDKVRKFGSSEATLVPSKSTRVGVSFESRLSHRDPGEPAAA